MYLVTTLLGRRQHARQVSRYGMGRHGYQRQLHQPRLRRVSPARYLDLYCFSMTFG
jgi:hypothetical protein